MINPMIFYWIDVASSVGVFLAALTVVSGVVSIFAGTFYAISVYDGDVEDDFSKLSLKAFKIALPVMIICVLLLVFIPSEKALIRMLIADNLTGENIEEATQFVIDTIKKFKE